MRKVKLVVSVFLLALFLNLSFVSHAEERPEGGSTGVIENYDISIFPNPIPKDSTFNISIIGQGFGKIEITFLDNTGKQKGSVSYEVSANNIKSTNEHKTVGSYTQKPSTQPTIAWNLILHANSGEFDANIPYKVQVNDTTGKKIAYSTFIKNDSTPQVGGKANPICKLENGVCREVNTALGKIDPDPMKVVSTVLRYLIGLSGGLFLLIIIRAGYRMITSQGNPEQVKEARESLISAVTGFIFLLFAFIVLEIIGVDLFQLPGFNP